MPYDNLPESQWADMDKCKQSVMDGGQDEPSAIAMCYATLTGKAKTIEEAAQMLKDGKIEIKSLKSFGLTVKAAGDWELDVLGMPFGGPLDGKDTDGQYFNQNTQAYLDVYKTIPAFYYHGYSPEGKPMGEPVQIGMAKYTRTDKDGHWYRVILDRTKDLAKRIWDAAKNGVARASSGSIAHLVRVAKDGFIQSWPVCELSLIDAEGKRQPANNYAVAMPVMKSHFENAGMQMPVIPADDPEAAGAAAANTGNQSPKHKEFTMDEKDLIRLLDERDAAKAKEVEAAEKARAVQDTAIKAAVDKAVTETADKINKEWASKFRLPGGMPRVNNWADTAKYDALDAAELGLMISLQNSLHAAKSDKMAPVSVSAYKALALKVARLGGDGGNKESVYTKAYAQAALKAAIGLDLTDEAIKGAFKTNDGDPNYIYTNIGSDWVGTAYSNQLWEAIRSTPTVVAKIPSETIPDGYASETWPLESTDPTWYKVAEVAAGDSTLHIPAATVTASTIGTLNKNITVGKMGARDIYSGELTEDSLIGYVPNLRRQLQLSGAEQMEHVVIDGDTAAASNINDIGGTTYSGAATTLFLLTNGFRKIGIANGRSASGALSEDDYLETVRKLGLNGIAADVAKCAFIVDPNVYFASLKMATVKTKDVWTNATMESGVLARLWNYPINQSYFMHWRQPSRKANTAGKVDLTTVGNNTTGGIIAVRWDQWKIAYKRLMTIETTRIANADSWEVVALTRWGLGYRDAYASAETYNVGV